MCSTAFLVATYVSLKVTPQDVDCILYFDCTKLGVLQQAEINMLGDYAEKLLFKNPQRPILIFEQGPKPVLHYFFCDLACVPLTKTQVVFWCSSRHCWLVQKVEAVSVET